MKDFTPETWDDATIHLCRHSGPFVVKGKRSSRKWQWKSHMFAETKHDALALGARLREDSDIKEQGVVYRRYVPLKTFEIGRNGLPYTNEWRFFYFGSTLLNAGYYWSVGDCFKQASMTAECLAMAERIAQIVSKFATFYTLDLAETAEGDWILIEINDAQMAVPSEHDLDALYGKLNQALAERWHAADHRLRVARVCSLKPVAFAHSGYSFVDKYRSPRSGSTTTISLPRFS